MRDLELRMRAGTLFRKRKLNYVVKKFVDDKFNNIVKKLLGSIYASHAVANCNDKMTRPNLKIVNFYSLNIDKLLT